MKERVKEKKVNRREKNESATHASYTHIHL